MAEPLGKRLFTRDEYSAMAEAGILKPEDRVELIEGEIYRRSASGDRHALGVTLLVDAFSVLSAQGRASLAPQNPVHLSDVSEPEPDLALLHRRLAGSDPRHPTPGLVFLLVEVADSSLAYDQQTKIPLYARCGIPEAWLVDLTRNVLEVHRDPTPGGYRSVQRLRKGDRIAPQAFPDFEIEVASILPPRPSPGAGQKTGTRRSLPPPARPAEGDPAMPIPPRRPLLRLTDRQPLGRSGLQVSPICLGATPRAETVVAAFDAGINFFLLSADLHWPVYEGTRRGLEALLARGGGVRDEIVVGVVSYLDEPLFHALQLHEVLDAVPGLGRVDLMIAGAATSAASFYPRLNVLVRARAAGRHGAPAIGVSFHDRPLALKAATFELLDIAFVRYNTIHPGARSDLFPFLPPRRSTRVFNFKSTMFHVTPERLRALGLSPAQCWLPAVPDYYRFALSRPELDGILVSLYTPEEVAALAAALAEGALLPEEEEHMIWLSSVAARHGGGVRP